jgi:hypothetical protein
MATRPNTRKKRQYYKVLHDPSAYNLSRGTDIHDTPDASEVALSRKKRGRPLEKSMMEPYVAPAVELPVPILAPQNVGGRTPNASSASSSTSAAPFIYQIESLLFKKTMTHMEWRAFLSHPKYHTREITRGSVWLVPDSIWYDDGEVASTRLVTKYLVKWKGMSYLHLSWELPSDLMDTSICIMSNDPSTRGQERAKVVHALNQVDRDIMRGFKLFPDLVPGEFFPP